MKTLSVVLQALLLLTTIYLFWSYHSGFDIDENVDTSNSLTDITFAHDASLHPDKKTEDPKKPDDPKDPNPDDKKPDDKNPDDKDPDHKNPDDKNPDDKDPDHKNPDDKDPKDPKDDKDDDNLPKTPKGKIYPQINYKSPDRGKFDHHCSPRLRKQLTLCNIGLKNNCIRKYITEEVHTFWILTPIYTANPKQTERLYQLHRYFRDFVRVHGVNLQTVEVIFPGQEFQLTKPNNEPYDIQFKDDWIFCMRENLINVGAGYLPDDWQFMAWIDQHIWWEDPYWFEKAMWLMSHYNIVHLLNGNDFWDIHNKTMYHLDGFARIWTEVGDRFWMHDPRQCGCAWSMRREVYEALGGILDICIGTKCDLYQNYAFAGMTYTSQIGNQEYADEVAKWQRHAIDVFQKKMWFLDTKIIHFQHCDIRDGCKTSEYNDQIYALMRNNYNPRTDLTRDANRRLRLTNNINLAKELWVIYGGNPRLRMLEALKGNNKIYDEDYHGLPDLFTS